ncbi:MAG TPA: acyltransferase [Pseudolabrys sp.]
MTKRSSERSYIALDLLRALAALAVMLDHIRGATWVDFGALPAPQHTSLVAIFFALTRIGYEAVLVFFVLSGALVGGQILSRVRQRRFSLPDYGIDRGTRILVPLIPACLLTVAINWLFLGKMSSFASLVATMFGFGNLLISGLAGNEPLWSLTYEIWFYVLGGALAYLVVTRTSIVAFAVVTASVCVFTVIGPKFLLFWMLGAATTLIIDLPNKKTVFAIGCTVATAGIAFSQLASASMNYAHTSYIDRRIAEVLVCGGICMMLPLMYSERANSALHLIARPVAFVSGMSYTLYLVHYPVLNAVNQMLPRANELSASSAAYFLIRVAICSATALVCYLLFERQTPALRRWVRSSFTGAGLKVERPTSA